MALKELLDNALDAAETAGVAPAVAVEFTESENGLILSVADNGPGIPAEIVARILDFTTRTSDKAAYRAPTRGAQGNALKTVLGIPVALGDEHGRLRVEAAGVRHDIEVWITPAGVKPIHRRTAAETHGTRITLAIPGSLEAYNWRPTRWLMAFGLFNPHAKLQIRKIAALEGAIEPVESDDDDFSDLCAAPTVVFPSDWRKFLPTDPTPAHWYTGPEFARLVHLKAAVDPGQAIGAFIQEFKGLSRVWRQASKAVEVKTMGQLADAPPVIPVLHEAMRAASAAPRPEVLGRVGPEHFRQRFHEHFQIVGDRYWYKHRWAETEGMPYLIEVAIAETERRGGVFYGLNYSVPFGDPLADTVMDFESKDGSLSAKGIAGFLQDAGVYCGERYGKSLRDCRKNLFS